MFSSRLRMCTLASAALGRPRLALSRVLNVAGVSCSVTALCCASVSLPHSLSPLPLGPNYVFVRYFRMSCVPLMLFSVFFILFHSLSFSLT